MTADGSAGKKRVAIIGAGSWGTALAMVAARKGHDVRLWARESEVAAGIRDTGKNPYYLSEFELSTNIRATTSLAESLDCAELVLNVVPSHAVREIAASMSPLLNRGAVFVSATKGVENGTLMRMSEVIADVMRGRFEPGFVALSGPSFALEVAKGYPTAIVAASKNPELSEMVQRELSSSAFRIYTNDDVVGVELCGAVKNVVAISAGVVIGLGFGMNSVAALITRGLAEITRFAMAQGSRPETMAGLAGLGDLVLTCTGDLSRNRRVGVELGRGRKLADILSETREVAEGVKTCRAIYELSVRLNVDMPIIANTYSLLYEDKPALEAASQLMERPLRRE